MPKRRRIEGIDGEFSLPEPMIQHIQSFLTGKEAAQTSILSKSWHIAWSTRPNLDFDAKDFPNNDEFWAFVKKTMLRYEELTLKIQSFRLVMIRRLSISISYSFDMINKLEAKDMKVAAELIVKAMRMGASDFNLIMQCYSRPFILPREVIGSETLIRLSLSGFDLELGEESKVRCAGLKYLSLQYVCIKKDTLWDIVSSCPSIENFTLQGKWRLGSVVDGPTNVYKLCKLKNLVLGYVDVHTSCFSDLLSKFPFLKELTISHCGGYNYKGIKLCSRSLECISFEQDNMLRAKCEVPNIHKFKFFGKSLPSFSFKTASREWESDITVFSCRGSVKWFLKLNELLTCLSLSRITLSLDFNYMHVVERDLDFQCLPAVENLLFYASSSVCSTLSNCLFRSCHPKFIIQNWYPGKLKKETDDFLQILCKKLVGGVRGSESTVCVVQDLEGVNVEVFEKNLAEWRPLPWQTLLDDSSRPKITQKVRFQLIWRREL